MTPAITPALPVSASLQTAPLQAALDQLFTPGAVLNAKVLQVLDANLVRIVIADLAMDVQTQIPLQQGATLQLAVSTTPQGGVRLAVTGQTLPSTSAPPTADAPPIAPDVAAAVRGNVAATLSAAVQSAAPRQASLAPLFANLPVVVASDAVPADVKQIATQMLQIRPELNGTLTADSLKSAVRNSGIFYEAALASGAPAAQMADTKAVLMAFRQVLSSWLVVLPKMADGSQRASTVPDRPMPLAVANVLRETAVGVSAGRAGPAGLPVAATALPQSDDPLSGMSSAPEALKALLAQMQSTGRQATPVGQDILKQLLGEALDGGSGGAQGALARLTQSLAARPAMDPALSSEPVDSFNVPPPLRNGPLSSQPIAAPSITSDMPPETVGQKLLQQTDAALARQTLLQVASLPDNDPANVASRTQDAQGPRWSFEIPFATPQGTAMAQFEISRDGRNSRETAGVSRVWRARFTLALEPAGPIHALVLLTMDETSSRRASVRMWAERAETNARLREATGELGQALRRAELEPGDIVVADGAPPKRAPAPAGHFLDRAT